MSESIDFYAKKITIIIFASICNFLIASFLSQKVEKILIKLDKTRNNFEKLASLCTNISIIAVFAYLLRQISETLPMPFSSKNFDPSKVKEVKGSVLTAFTLFLFFGEYIKEYKELLYEIM